MAVEISKLHVVSVVLLAKRHYYRARPDDLHGICGKRIRRTCANLVTVSDTTHLNVPPDCHYIW